MVNLGDLEYKNLQENHMDLMFGFFQRESRVAQMFPIALPEQYGSFSLLISGQK